MHQVEAKPEDGGKITVSGIASWTDAVAAAGGSQTDTVIYSVTETGVIRQDDLEGISVAVAYMGGKTREVKEPHHLFPQRVPISKSMEFGPCRGTHLILGESWTSSKLGT